ncbi:MAG: hypothetical protein R3C59_14370 [Planctomycetaceae bacterium]
MGNGITDFIEANQELAKGVSVTLASDTLARLAGESATKTAKALRFGSILVEPAVWVLTAKTPGFVDLLYAGTGAVATYAGKEMISKAAFGASIAKAVIDNQTSKKLKEAMNSERDPVRASQMKLCSDQFFFSSGESIDALKIAKSGGVVWQHPNGLWVCIKDATGHFVCDYEPKVYAKVYCPVLPLEPISGGFDWFAY